LKNRSDLNLNNQFASTCLRPARRGFAQAGMTKLSEKKRARGIWVIWTLDHWNLFGPALAGLELGD